MTPAELRTFPNTDPETKEDARGRYVEGMRTYAYSTIYQKKINTFEKLYTV